MLSSACNLSVNFSSLYEVGNKNSKRFSKTNMAGIVLLYTVYTSLNYTINIRISLSFAKGMYFKTRNISL